MPVAMICVECSLDLIRRIKIGQLELPEKAHVVFHCFDPSCTVSEGWIMYDSDSQTRYTYH
jgi:hypothetical protein